MFLLHTLFVFVVIYVSSALLAETIFTSKIEKKLPTGVRVGLGYFLSLFYFVSAWLFLSIRQAWLFGILLLGLYVYGKISKGWLVLEWGNLKCLLIKHAKTLGVFLLSANLFFIPLHFAGHYGPFTEGGGDITIYSDIAKRLTDFNLNAVGLDESASLKERFQRIKELINRDYSDWYKAQGPNFINPPNANYQTNKVAFNLYDNPLQYTPCAQFAFLSGETNYSVFYAVVAFLYSLILVSAWGFFRQFGLMPAMLSVLLIGGSNGLVSGFYNMYLLQNLSTTILALTLSTVPFIRLFSIAGLRVYGFGSLFILMSYPHFFPIIAPLLVIASIAFFYKESEKTEISNLANNSLTQNLFHYFPLIIFFSLCLVEIYVGYGRTFYWWSNLFTSFLAPSPNYYAGESALKFSDQWWTFIFGLASQQHFFPYMVEHKVMNLVLMLGTYAGFILLAISLLLILSCKSQPASGQQENKKIWHYIGIYAALVIVIGIYSGMTQTTLYTQAKGAQYLLICLYFVMLLPFAILDKRFGPIKLQNPFANKNKNKKIAITTSFYVLILFVFSAFLWVPRVIYAHRIGHYKDRSTIIEPSFFAEARRIKAEDKNAFVIFEPRTSSDVYFPFQAFAGYRLIPTRHLILDQFYLGNNLNESHKVYKLPSDFVKPDDIPHLWSLTAVKEKEGKYRWKAEKLTDNTIPKLIFTGHRYKRNLSPGPRVNPTTSQAKNKARVMYSYINNGTAMIYLPPGGPYSLEIKLLARYDDSFEELEQMSKSIKKRANAGEFPSIKSLSTHGYIITLNFEFSANSRPRISLVSKYDKEYWFNARLNGKEIGDLIN